METLSSQWELYKLLKEEYKHYLDHAENLWRTKFIAIGAFISLAILNEKLIEILKTQPDKANEVTALGILIIPMLAFVIDLKILETGFHLKNISTYIEKHFNELSLAQGWERENWGNNRITLFRKWITLFLSVGVSLIILNLCLFIISLHSNLLDYRLHLARYNNEHLHACTGSICEQKPLPFQQAFQSPKT